MPTNRGQSKPNPVSTSPSEPKKKSWWLEAKPTEWITALATCVGLIAVYRSGILDAKKAETSAQNERLTMEKLRLEDRKEQVVRELDQANARLSQVQGRLLPLEREREAIRQLVIFRNTYSTEKLVDNSFWITFDLADDLKGWRLEVRPSTKKIDWSPWGTLAVQRVVIFQDIQEIVRAAADVENLQSLRIVGCDLTTDDIKHINSCLNLTRLELLNCNVDDAEIAGLEYGMKIEEVNISYNGITNFPVVKKHPSVRRFFADNTKLANESVLSALWSFPNVEVLMLFDTPIGDPAMVGVASLTKLQYLSVERTDVSEKGILLLINLPDVRQIGIEQSRLTPQTLQLFHERNPLLTLGSPPAPMAPTAPTAPR